MRFSDSHETLGQSDLARKINTVQQEHGKFPIGVRPSDVPAFGLIVIFSFMVVQARDER